MKFELGQVVITRNCLYWMTEKDLTPLPFIRRHASGDWGDLGPEDKRLNEQALNDGGRLFSSYKAVGETIYVITEHDRFVTTVMLAEDY